MNKKKEESKSSVKMRDLGRRRFPRVSLRGDFGPAQIILGAKVYWPQGNDSGVFDLSYSGAALEKPASFRSNKEDIVSLEFKFSGNRTCVAPSRIAWFNDKAVGVEFLDLKLEDRAVLDEFLEDRLIGNYLHKIDPMYFNKGVDFQYWYHGPKETNVYLWTKGENEKLEIIRALVELDGQMLTFENGQIQGEGYKNKKAEGVEDELPVILDKEMPIVRRVMELLSQIEEHEAPIAKLFESLMRVK